MAIQNVDKEALRRQYLSAEPFPFVKIDDLLDPAFAEEVANSYPSFEAATEQGREFKSVNERRKVQVTDSKLFPQAAKRLNEILAAPEFLSTLSYISGIPSLLADEELVGGGLHVTGPGGKLDVHVDFNFIEQRKLHRRLNLLLYLNPVWKDEWGGHIQLWDKKVTRCQHDLAPMQNRCVIFETSDISYHGVTPVAVSAPFARRSFAAYYYTKEAPAYWKGTAHSTIFQARPDERMSRYILMPAERLLSKAGKGIKLMKRGVKRVLRG